MGLGVCRDVCHAVPGNEWNGTKRLSSEAAARIAGIACELCIEAGIGNLTMRAVAERAGLTPPAVVYHFGNREKLLLAALEALRQRLSVAYGAIAARLRAEAPGDMDAHSAVCAALIELVATQGGAFVASDDVARALATTAQAQQAGAVLAGMYGDAETFWRSLPAVDAMPEDARVLCVAVASGLIPYAILDRVAVRRNAMIIQAITRLFARLHGAAVILREAAGDLAPLEDEARPEGKQQIVEATIRLSGRLGVAGLTHRNIASEAGLSAAAITYFYPTKEDIVVDAARVVQMRAIDAVIAGQAPPPEFPSHITLDANSEERSELAALTAFMNAAATLPDLDNLAATFRRIRGLAAVRWLRARGYAVDRLDGIIWSSATTTLTQRALLQPKAQRAAFLDETAEVWLRRLFGKA